MIRELHRGIVQAAGHDHTSTSTFSSKEDVTHDEVYLLATQVYPLKDRRFLQGLVSRAHAKGEVDQLKSALKRALVEVVPLPPPRNTITPPSAFLTLSTIQLQLSSLIHWAQDSSNSNLVAVSSQGLLDLLAPMPLGKLCELEHWESGVLDQITSTLQDLSSPHTRQAVTALLLALSIQRGSLKHALKVLCGMLELEDQAVLPPTIEGLLSRLSLVSLYCPFQLDSLLKCPTSNPSSSNHPTSIHSTTLHSTESQPTQTNPSLSHPTQTYQPTNNTIEVRIRSNAHIPPPLPPRRLEMRLPCDFPVGSLVGLPDQSTGIVVWVKEDTYFISTFSSSSIQPHSSSQLELLEPELRHSSVFHTLTSPSPLHIPPTSYDFLTKVQVEEDLLDRSPHSIAPSRCGAYVYICSSGYGGIIKVGTGTSPFGLGKQTVRGQVYQHRKLLLGRHSSVLLVGDKLLLAKRQEASAVVTFVELHPDSLEVVKKEKLQVEVCVGAREGLVCTQGTVFCSSNGTLLCSAETTSEMASSPSIAPCILTYSALNHGSQVGYFEVEVLCPEMLCVGWEDGKDGDQDEKSLFMVDVVNLERCRDDLPGEKWGVTSWAAGDVLGCLVEYCEEDNTVNIAFSRNGSFAFPMGVAFEGIAITGRLVPVISALGRYGMYFY